MVIEEELGEMYSNEKYKELSEKYGQVASWAIWDKRNLFDTKIIDKNIDQLNSNFILLGLNFSRDVSEFPNRRNWANFHSTWHDRKLTYSCNNTKLRGSYITDLFKNVVKSRSTNIEKVLSYQKIREDVDFIRQEMNDIEIDQNSKFIVFGVPGSTISKLYNRYFRQYFRNKVIFYYHYSYFTLTDKEWVEGFWKIMGINQDFYAIRSEFKNS